MSNRYNNLFAFLFKFKKGGLNIIRNVTTFIKFCFKGIIIFVGIILFLNLLVYIQGYPRIKTIEEIQHYDPNGEIPVMVFGAGVINNERPSEILKNRLDKAYELYQAQPNRLLIMSGDHREDNYNEVLVMKSYLVEKGIPSEQIYLDHAGYSTYDSLYRMKHVFELPQLIAITQGYHLPRAILLARHLDIDLVGLKADETSSTRIEREFREIFARLKDIGVTFGFNPGEIDMTGQMDFSKSGDLTNKKD